MAAASSALSTFSAKLRTTGGINYQPFSLLQHELYKMKLIRFVNLKKKEYLNVNNNFENYLKKSKEYFWQNYHMPAKTNLTSADFDFIKILGNGTFGVVLMAMKSDNEHFYAIKVINKRLLIEKKYLPHVKSERFVLQALNFPFLINLEYFYQTVNNLFYVMPLVLGNNLHEMLKIEFKFRESVARFYLAQIVLALEFLQFIGVIHRDIKPENIVLDSNGYVKLVDFGLCKLLNGRTFTLCGSPEYMAPEILKNQGYDAAIDWWAFGILAYELCSGTSPFKAHSVKKIFTKILKGAYHFPSYFSIELKDFISRFLITDKTKRINFVHEGITFIKSHLWFYGINWNGIINRTLPPPIIPNLTKFGKLIKLEIVEANEGDDPKKYERWFKDF